MTDVMIAGIFTAVGAGIGFLGTLIQSFISARNNKKMVKLEAEKELQMRMYLEREHLYSDIISFLPQMDLSMDRVTKKIQLSSENKMMLNSFKARLSLYSSKKLYDEFYEVLEKILTVNEVETRVKLIDDFTEKMLKDLRNSFE